MNFLHYGVLQIWHEEYLTQDPDLREKKCRCFLESGNSSRGLDVDLEIWVLDLFSVNPSDEQSERGWINIFECH
jgi:hypothetical protein